MVRQTGYSNPQQLPTIDLASAATITTATVLGIAAENILDGATGQVVISGSYNPIDTSAFVAGAKVYLSDTSGEISTVPGTFETVVGYATIIGVMGCISILCLPPTNNCNTGSGSQGAIGIQGATGIGSGTGGDSQIINMHLFGRFIDAGTLPFTPIGPELAATTVTFTEFRAQRGTPGASGGTTTIELELNGTPTGDTLSWTNADGMWAIKTAAISVAVVPGDRLSLRLTSRESGSIARDIIAEVNA